ncbi:MAG TPA: helix-turn-helix domain-containing protein [Streptosporangiaceae bacterium]
MSVKLVVEVLDHYHGPTHRKLWLIAWAEKVTGESRTGYCKREVLAARLGRSPSRVSHIARELEDEGTIKRLGGGVWGKAAVYELLPLDASQGDPRAHPAQGDPRAHPTAEPGTHPVSAPATHSQGDPRAHPIPDNPDKPSIASRRTTRTGGRGEPAATDDDDDSSIQSADLDGGAEGAPAPVRDRPGPGYGLCPECRDWYVVKATGGRLGRHNADTGGGWSSCPGREPAEPVPCAGCGRTGVALTGYAGLCYACREALKEAGP